MDDKPNLVKNLGNAGKGRPKGVPNKIPTNLKQSIIQAAVAAGGKGGMVAYLTQQASKNPGPFMSLLGKVLPTVVSGDEDNPILHVIERRIVNAKAVD